MNVLVCVCHSLPLGRVTMLDGSLAGLTPQGLLALTLNW